MATRTIITTDAQEEVLRWLVNTLNTEQGTRITVDQLLQREFPSFLRPYELRYREVESKEVVKAFANVRDPILRASIKEALGIEL